MCTPTTLRFCTCSTTDISQLTHYWRWIRPADDVVTDTVGLFVVPETTVLDPLMLEQQLQAPDVFDTAMDFQDGDVLEVVLFASTEDEQEWQYRYFNQQWCFSNDSLDTGVRLASGKIEFR
ncbi:MAG: hypothetical protein RLZZ500_513 [Bacteroidota bacterium]